MNETDSHIEGLSRNQTFLLPKTIEEYVQTDNPVRFIDAYVNTLDMEKLGFTHSTPQDLGRPFLESPTMTFSQASAQNNFFS